MFNFYFYMWAISLGFVDAVIDMITGRSVVWAKTKRFVKENKSAESAAGEAGGKAAVR